ncbi:SET domain-containing protein [Panus rudis PR-1116 ss-1]|nr:SET domain-containing protein [Panus rudis PR-1116 ss-1]
MIETTAMGDHELLEIRTNAFSGRSYYSKVPIEADTVLFDVSTPYSYTIYKRFRNEVCAECFTYQSGRRAFLTCREYGETAGLLFCDTNCRDRWIEREGMEMVELLSRLEKRRMRKPPKKEDQKMRESVTEEEVERAWERVKETERDAKQLRKWGQVSLEDYEADQARYVLMALYHYAREQSQEENASASSDQEPKSAGVSFGGGAHWQSFASLQSNELEEVKRFPELLDNHIRIYQALKSLLCGPPSAGRASGSRNGNRPNSGGDDGEGSREREASGTLARLVQVMTVDNVRRALGVDPGNSFGIWETPLTDESECLGYGVYPIPSLFNHHCSPNVRKNRRGRGIGFVTTRRVSAGEEMCISYGHVENMTVGERRKTLREGWYFECQCSRCVAEASER